MMNTVVISDLADLQTHFGSFAAAARALGMSPQALNDAKRRGVLPKHRFFEQRAMFQGRGLEAPVSLWGFEQPEIAE